ncbi:sugar kinase [Gilliamella apicola]|uniref:Sugar kinase n=1 Tax=Gilliamella apicola TaxID=1196095 RepID=A0A1B9JIH7_9GAMM|nr:MULTISPECIES: sugar kinase [Gilliamella]MBI0094059.1 sugar kinase [Gilliamella sp. W8136]OCF92458.1 sugar kinase [Gilliamella apicola]OTP91266.1 sugar kinase [Gilliamella apicola]OTP95659.1 sugar kinase [Gilliamella apicola]OTP96867.1 sugar kinase [Gilliamella apicola]
MQFKICTIGELLVEFLAKKQNQRFDQTGEFIGPFPSGAPAIFADQVAKLGFPVIFFSCIGKDPFGNMCIKRLKQDGVIIDGITTHNKANTGSAFVTYKGSNDRDFIFNIPNSACGLLSFNHINENLLKDCNHLHVMGSSLYSFRAIDAMRKALDIIKSKGGTISFDPNLRKEMFNIQEMEQSFDYIMEYTDIFLPSESEVSYFASSNDESEDQTMFALLNKGIKHIVVKKGSKGANYYGRDDNNNLLTLHVDGFITTPVDPTGAGDCFGATFISLMLAGYSVEQALQYANASGALAVSKTGPMEGTSTFAELKQFIAKYEQ